MQSPSPEPLEEIQDRIVEQLHAGEQVDQAAVIAAHPEHAEALRGFFRVLALVERGPEPPATPSRLGEFQILRELGRGGMGVVYEAEQLSLKRRVALKVLPPALGLDGRLKVRFQREAEAAARLRHPNIVPVFSFGDVAGTPFFAMELVDGRSISRILSDLREGREHGVPARGAARRAWAVGIAAKIAEALSYAHAQGIVHRDVKPGNILIDAHGEPRLTDFGLASETGGEGLTRSGEVFGSPRYMSPEQAFRRQLPIDHRTDIYSLGVTLFEMLTLAYPFEGATSLEYMASMQEGRPTPARRFDAEIPEALERVLGCALAKDPAGRYADAAALAEDLRAVLEARPVAAPLEAVGAGASAGGHGGSVPPNLPATPAPKRSSWKRNLVLVTAGLLALMGIGATVYRLIEDAHRPQSAITRYAANAMWPELPLLQTQGGRPRGGWALLADGALPAGASALERAIRPHVGLREVLSREQLGEYELRVALAGVDAHSAGVWVSACWMVSFDDENQPDGAVVLHPVSEACCASLEPGVGGSNTLRVKGDLRALLAQRKSSESVALRHHLTVKVGRRRLQGTSEAAFRDLPAKETVTWSESKTLFLYDRFPEDYPRRVQSPELDHEVAQALTPDTLVYAGTTLHEGRKAVRFQTGLGERLTQVPVAGEYSLSLPGAGKPFARITYVQDSGSEPLRFQILRNPRVATIVGRELVVLGGEQPLLALLEPMPADEEVRLLADLEGGRIPELRVVFEGSREVALEGSDFDTYWGGRFEANVAILGRSGEKR